RFFWLRMNCSKSSKVEKQLSFSRMASTAAAKRVLKAQSKRRSARIRWFTRCTSRVKKPSGAAEGDLVFPVAVRWVGVALWAAGVAVSPDVIRKKSGPMARKFWSEFRKKPAGE